MFSKFFPSSSGSLPTIAAGVAVVAAAMAASVLTAGSTKAAVLADVNFNTDTVGNAPPVSPYTSPNVETNPMSIGSSSGYSVTVVSSLGGLTNQPVQLQTQNNGGSGFPNVSFGSFGVASSPVTISWDSEITAYSVPTTGNIENVMNFELLNGVGVDFGNVTYGTRYTAGVAGSGNGNGYIIMSPSSGSYSYASGANNAWTVGGGVDHFVLQFNPGQSNQSLATFTLSRNGSPLETGTLGSAEASGFSYFQIASGGGGAGGQDSAWTAGVDNVEISTSTPEPASLGLLAVGGLGLLLVGKRRHA